MLQRIKKDFCFIFLCQNKNFNHGNKSSEPEVGYIIIDVAMKTRESQCVANMWEWYKL